MNVGDRVKIMSDIICEENFGKKDIVKNGSHGYVVAVNEHDTVVEFEDATIQFLEDEYHVLEVVDEDGIAFL